MDMMLNSIQMTEHYKVKTSSLVVRSPEATRNPQLIQCRIFFFLRMLSRRALKIQERKYLVNYIVNDVLQHFSGLYRS